MKDLFNATVAGLMQEMEKEGSAKVGEWNLERITNTNRLTLSIQGQQKKRDSTMFRLTHRSIQ